MKRPCILAGLVALMGGAVQAQQLDLAHGGPIGITARDGIEWRQADREVIARGDAQAVRGDVTVTADRLIAFYRPKDPAAAPQPQPGNGISTDDNSGGNEIYRVQAEGHVNIFTPTDHAQGDHAVYDLDQAVMVMTGHDLRMTTPNEVLTARDTLEYWAQKHMAVARGDAVVVTKDARRLAADVLVAYTTDTSQQQPAATQVAAKPAASSADDQGSGKLQKVEAFGHVSVRTSLDTGTGDRAVYVPDTGIARLAGHVHLTRGDNQLNGAEAEVNMKTGISRLLSAADARVHGLIVPNDATNQQLTGQQPPAAAKPSK